MWDRCRNLMTAIDPLTTWLMLVTLLPAMQGPSRCEGCWLLSLSLWTRMMVSLCHTLLEHWGSVRPEPPCRTFLGFLSSLPACHPPPLPALVTHSPPGLESLSPVLSSLIPGAAGGPGWSRDEARSQEYSHGCKSGWPESSLELGHGNPWGQQSNRVRLNFLCDVA